MTKFWYLWGQLYQDVEVRLPTGVCVISFVQEFIPEKIRHALDTGGIVINDN